MDLTDTQKQKVAAWIKEGLKLSEIQRRLESEFGARMTYLEVRFLIDDLKLTPKEQEPPRVEKKETIGGPLPPSGMGLAEKGSEATETAPAGPGVSVTVDHLARPGALVSGNVTFSDGNAAAWYLDQTGRLGVVPQQQGYKPSAADVQAFQTTLSSELQKLGF